MGSSSSKTRSNRKERQRQQQRGGGSCAAMPLNRELLAPQRGGMAPFASLDNGYLIDQSARVQAETYPLDQAIGELPAVIARGAAAAQNGGRRSRSRNQRKQRQNKRQRQSRKQNKKQNQSRKQRQQRQQRQRGGMYPIDADTMLLSRGAENQAGLSSMFSNEQLVNKLYDQYSGAQGPHTR